MSHLIEQQSNGNYSFVSAREPAWHNLGKVYDQDGLTLDQVLIDLNAGKVVTAPVTAHVVKGVGVKAVTLPDKKMTIRERMVNVGGYIDVEHTPLGIVGKDYSVIPEREAFAFCQSLVDEGGANIQTAGLLDDGKRAFCCMKFPEGVLIGGVDPVDLFLVVALSHDGSMSLTGMATPIRTVCQNTLTWGIQAARQKWTVRHSKHADKKMNVEEARRNLNLTFTYAGEWAERAEALLNAEMTKLQFEQIVKDMYEPPVIKTKASQTVWDARFGRLLDLWDAPTQQNIAGTAWAGLNTFIEEQDWYLGTRNADNKEGHMFERSIMGGATPAKTAIYNRVRAFAGV